MDIVEINDLKQIYIFYIYVYILHVLIPQYLINVMRNYLSLYTMYDYVPNK